MRALGSRPLLAVSLAIPSIILIGYLWQKRRAQETEANEELNQHLGVIDSREVSLKLESLNRSRLDCIEEERNEVQEETVVKSDFSLPLVATCIEVSELTVLTESTELIISTIETESSDTEPTIPEPEVPRTISTETETSQVPTMTVKKVMDEVEEMKKDGVPDVFSALKDPLCELSTSPVKSESLDSQRSCESWSDLMEQDELEKNLCEKLSTLDLSDNTRHDSGVASPTDELSDSSGRKPSDDKSRMSSGEDAGIGGSETGELRVFCSEIILPLQWFRRGVGV